jgi:hypothetical protein
MPNPNERRGFLKALCALLDQDFTTWRDIQFAQFFLGENLKLSPSETSRSLVGFFRIREFSPEISVFECDFRLSALYYRQFLGSKAHGSRFTFTADQHSLLRSKFKGLSFQVLATVFMASNDENLPEKAIWRRSDHVALVQGMRFCDQLSFEDLVKAMKSKKSVIVEERPAEPTAAGLAAVAAIEEAKDRSFQQRVIRPRCPPVATSRPMISDVPSSRFQGAHPNRAGVVHAVSLPPPPAELNHSPAPSSLRQSVSIDPSHDYHLTSVEITALREFWTKHFESSMIFSSNSFDTIFSCYLNVETGCSMVIMDGVVTEARMCKKDHPKLEAWIKKGCPY